MTASASTRRRLPRSAPWVVMALVLGTALVVGAGSRAGPATLEQRVRSVTSEIRCPTCRSQSVADSDAPAAVFIKDEVRERLRAGEPESEIRDYLFSRYGNDIRLRPETTGVASLVWALPVIGVLGALVGLTVAFRRWRPRSRTGVSTADRERVERALHS